MKQLFILLIVFFVLVNCSLPTHQEKEENNNIINPDYKDLNHYSENEIIRDKLFLIIADSRFDYYDISNIKYTCYNYGRGSISTIGILNRIDVIQNNIGWENISIIIIHEVRES